MPPKEEVDAYVDAITSHPVNLAQIVKIEGPDGPEYLDLWPDQITVLNAALEHRKLIVLKARQLGITWTMMLLALWETIAYPTGTTLVVSLNEEEAKVALDRAKFMYDSTPEWFKVVFPVAASNATSLVIDHVDGESRISAVSSSGTAGRGRTLRRIIADERAFWENESQRMASLAPAAADSGRICEVSTANGRNGFCDTWNGAIENGGDPETGNGYGRIFIGALAHPNRDRKWVERERQALDAQEPGLGAQEYPLHPGEAFRSTGHCVFDEDGLQEQLDHACKSPKSRVRLRKAPGMTVADPHAKGEWRVWEWPKKGRDYLIAADVCGGVRGGDYSYASVFDWESWDQVACYHGQPEPGEFTEELMLAGRLWSSQINGQIKPAMIVPEANNHGQAVCALLWERRYPRVYRSEGFEAFGSRPTVRLGWLTTAKTRPIALEALQEYVRHGLGAIRDEEAVGECFRFVEKDTGKWEADTGAHDDRVMALAIGVAVLARSRVVTSRKRTAERRVPHLYAPRVSSKTGY